MLESEFKYSPTECIFCYTDFDKSNKPLVLKCSHNICQACHNLNKESNKLLCLICKRTFEDKEARRLPINFLLLEIIEAESKKVSPSKKRRNSSTSKINSVEVFRCLDCNLVFPNNLHFSHFPSHKLSEEKIVKEDKSSEINNKSNLLMQKFKDVNKKLENLNESFFKYLNEAFVSNKDSLVNKFRHNPPLENFVLFGLINETDKERIKEFTEKYLKDEVILNQIKLSSSFDEFVRNLIKLHKGNTYIHHFVSAYFFYIEIIEKKLSKLVIEEKLKRFKEDIDLYNLNLTNNSCEGVESNMCNLFKLFSQDLKVEVYNSLNLDQSLNNNLMIPHIVYLNKTYYNVVYFDPLTLSIKKIENINQFFPSELKSLKKFSYILESNFDLYISGGIFEPDEKDEKGENSTKYVSNCFSVNLISGEIKNFSNMSEPRINHSSIIINERLYILGGLNTHGEKLKLFEEINITNNKYTKLTHSPILFSNKPTMLNFNNDFIYIFDNLINFTYYELKTDKWTVCKPTYKGSYRLDLTNFVAILSESNLILMGGLDKETNQMNEGVYYLKDESCIISKKGEFNTNSKDSLLSYGFLLESNYLLEYSELLNEVKVYTSRDMASCKWEVQIKSNILIE